MDRAKIIYENTLSTLPAEVESHVLENLEKILANLDVPEGFFSIYFCSMETIQALNLQFRKVDEATDVLSWSYIDQPVDEFSEASLWGELAMCLEIVRKQAGASGLELSTEVLRLIVHGLVHLLGFDHETEADEKEMLRREIEILSMIDLGDLYTS